MENQNRSPLLDNLDPKPLPPNHQLAPPKRHIFAWLKYRHSQLTKKQKWLVAIALILLIAGGATAGYFLYRQFHKPTPSSSSKSAILKKTKEPSRLTGVEVPKKLNKRPVTGIMIENSIDARPQSGLKDAGVVFEAVAEGGITRFLALYQEARPSYIGPVRSVRPYYLDWLMPFDASIAHVGGAPKALQDIKKYHVRDLDQFANSSAYWRISSRTSPHNMYTSMGKLDGLNKSKGYTSSDFKGFSRKTEMPAPKSKRTASSIGLAISGFNYNVRYAYSSAGNRYLRSEGGSAHIDQKTHKRLSPKVVIALVMSRGIASDGQHTNYGTTNGGRAYVFQDGKVTIGTWKKTSREADLIFLKKDGSPLGLNPGQTWNTMVDKAGSVSYKH